MNLATSTPVSAFLAVAEEVNQEMVVKQESTAT